MESEEFAVRAGALREKVLASRTIIIGCEASPDPDCAGSALGLAELIGVLAPRARVVILADQGCPKSLQFLKGAKAIRPPRDQDLPCDLAIVVDGGIERCGPRTMPVVEAAGAHAIIDHHAVGSQRSYEVSLVDASEPSTTSLVARLAGVWGLELSANAASALYAGLIADTGSFQFESTKAETLRLAAHLVERGAKPSKIAERVQLLRPFDYLIFQGRVLSRVERALDGRVLMARVLRSDISGLDLGDMSLDRILRDLTHIHGVEVVVLLKDGPEFRGVSGAPWRRLSLRSAGRVDVARMIRGLDADGGGHRMASGGRLDGTDEEIQGRLMEAIRMALGAS